VRQGIQLKSGAKMRNIRLLLLFVAATLLVPTLTHAQSVASITGTVTDSSGATVPGASIKLTSTKTGSTYFGKTAGDGGYRIVDIPPGPGYVLTVQKDGFQVLTIANIYLPVATATTQDAKLDLGTINETVHVTAEGSVTLDTTDATIGNSFDMRAVEELPNQFRDSPANLLQRQPGVTPIPVGGNVPDDPLGIRGGSVTGARTDQSNIIVDGIDATDFGLGQAFVIAASIPVDAIQEFRTEVANPVSDTGRGSGASTFISTKSGSNDWHGTAQEWNRTALTEANTFFNKTTTPFIPREQLVRNQFGANVGGPIKKDKLFFFFDYDGRRDAEQEPVLRIVPLPNITALATGGAGAGINYINNSPGCDASSRLSTTPGCISLLPAAGACGSQTVQGLDPSCIGADAALTSFIAGRYPAANDMTQGDGVNTGGYRFSAPAPLKENIYLARIDYNLSSKHKLFTRFNFNNESVADTRNNISPVTGIAASVAFPGDPLTAVDTENDKAWVIGDTWTITPSTVNQFVYGESREQADFGIAYNPNGTNFQFEWMNFAFDPPYLRQSTQSHILPVPTFRDDWSQTRGTHNISFGGVFKPIRSRDVETNDFNFIGIGLNPLTPNLDPTLRPANILSDPTLDPSGVAAGDWDNMFMGMLGSWWLDEGVFNYLKNGTPLGLGVPHRVDYRYYEYEFYGQDSWRLTKSLTITYGLRYQYDSVPYETSGLEGVSTIPFNAEFDSRLTAGAAGISGFTTTPFLTYTLGGKANPGAPSLYHKNPLNFAPRFALAWNPSVNGGPLAKLLGDRKTVFRGGAAVIYDHTALNSINFIQDQNSFLFSNDSGGEFGGNTPEVDLSTDPRFTGINDLPITSSTPPVPPPFVNPLTPNVFGGVGIGQAEGEDNYTVDPNFKTPYSLAYTADVQRELPAGLQLDLGWVGRYAHRLTALADANQLVDFDVPADGQTLFQAIANLETEARAGATAATPQAILEDPNVCGPGCSDFIYSKFPNTLKLGGLGSIVSTMDANFIFGAPFAFAPNVGMSPQFSSNLYLTNKGWSSYNGLLVTLRKRFTNNLQGDFNYTYSHSMDNISVIADSVGNQAGTTPAVLCDVRSGAACRGNSEFDLTHSINADGVYLLPFGHGQRYGSGVSGWLDELIGGWEFSDITTWHTGFPFNAFAGVQTTSLLADSIGIFDGDKSALSMNIHRNPDGSIQFFSNPAAAAAAFSSPTGQQVGNRNVLRGPHYSNWDMALVKNFNLRSERYRLQLRMEAYNTFNHPNFAIPTNGFTSPQFGVISTTVGDPREMQFALRFDF
jgi:hypothetical protein